MISFLFETFLFYFLLSLLINQNIIFQIRDDFLRPFPCLDVGIQCQMREVCDAKYRIQKALLGNICGNTGTDRSQPFKMKFNTLSAFLTPRFHGPPYIVAQRRVLAKCFMQFYGKLGMYLSMRNQPPHFNSFRDPTDPLELLQAFLLKGESKRCLR